MNKQIKTRNRNPTSDKTKRNISISLKGKIPWNKGKTDIYSNETLQKMSEAAKGRVGENNPNFKGGVSKLVIYDHYAPQLEPYGEECRKSEEDSKFLEIKCAYCGRWHVPRIADVKNRINLGISGNDTHRLYCSPGCKQECPIYRQHKHHKGQENYNSREVQPELRQLVFARDNWICQKCGSTKSLQCHHIDPVKSNPIESADIDVCVTLCKKCHRWVHKNIKGCGYRELANC